MGIFNWGSQLANRIESMRLAESSLMTFANRFGGNASETLELFDTTIPSSSIPLKGKPKCQLTNNQDEFVMHGIKVIAKDHETRRNEGPPLVLLHGYANGALYFYRNLIGLSNHHFGGVVYALDMLGWGLSSRPQFNMKSIKGADDVDTAEQFFVESLEAWRKAHNLDKINLAGHSIGGYLSVAYCEKYPDRVDRLILISPAGVPHEDPSSTNENLPLRFRFMISFASTLWRWGVTPPSFVTTLPEGRGRKMVSGYVEGRLPAITCPEERSSLSEYLYLNAILPSSGADCLNKILKPMAYAKKPIVDRIPHLKVKNIAMIYGQNDWMDPSAAKIVQERCEKQKREGKEDSPTVSVYGVRHAGHLLMLENWKEFNSALILAGGGVEKISKNASVLFKCFQSDEFDPVFFRRPVFRRKEGD